MLSWSQAQTQHQDFTSRNSIDKKEMQNLNKLLLRSLVTYIDIVVDILTILIFFAFPPLFSVFNVAHDSNGWTNYNKCHWNDDSNNGSSGERINTTLFMSCVFRLVKHILCNIGTWRNHCLVGAKGNSTSVSPQPFDFTFFQIARKARGIPYQFLNRLLFGIAKWFNLTPEDVASSSSQNDSDSTFLVVDGHRNCDHLAKAKSIFIGLCPDRLSDFMSFGNVGVVVPHFGDQLRTRNGIVFDFKQDALKLAWQCLKNLSFWFGSQSIAKKLYWLAIALDEVYELGWGVHAESRLPIGQEQKYIFTIGA